MKKLNRRDFLKLAGYFSALLGLGASARPRLADALEQAVSPRAPVLWLQGQSCSGCSVSLLNCEDPGPVEILTRYLALFFHQTLSTATGATALETIEIALKTNDLVLIVEGSIPLAMPQACLVGGRPMADLIARAAARSKVVIAAGSCAAFGGIPAANHNPTGAVDVATFLHAQGCKIPVVRIPGCPCHPDWLVGTLVHLLKFGLPPLDSHGRPLAFFARLVHETCFRFCDYEREKFAADFSCDGCLFRLGCLGTLTHGDCNLRGFNGGTNSCIRSGAPCTGCTSPGFAREAGIPFFRKTELSARKDGKR